MKYSTAHTHLLKWAYNYGWLCMYVSPIKWFVLVWYEYMIIRVQKFSAISCSRGRDYSAFPVRHIPKRSNESQESESALPKKHFLDIEKNSFLNRKVQETEFSVGGGGSKYGDIPFHSKSRNHKQKLITSLDDEVEWGMVELIHISLLFLPVVETQIQIRGWIWNFREGRWSWWRFCTWTWYSWNW